MDSASDDTLNSTEFVTQISLLFKHIARIVNNQNKKHGIFPHSKEFYTVLGRYVTLECNVLFSSPTERLIKVHIQKRLVNSFTSLLYDANWRLTRNIRSYRSAALLHILFIFTLVSKECKNRWEYLENMAVIVVKELNMMGDFIKLVTERECFSVQKMLRLPNFRILYRFFQKCNKNMYLEDYPKATPSQSTNLPEPGDGDSDFEDDCPIFNVPLTINGIMLKPRQDKSVMYFIDALATPAVKPKNSASKFLVRSSVSTRKPPETSRSTIKPPNGVKPGLVPKQIFSATEKFIEGYTQETLCGGFDTETVTHAEAVRLDCESVQFEQCKTTETSVELPSSYVENVVETCAILAPECFPETVIADSTTQDMYMFSPDTYKTESHLPTIYTEPHILPENFDQTFRAFRTETPTVHSALVKKHEVEICNVSITTIGTSRAFSYTEPCDLPDMCYEKPKSFRCKSTTQYYASCRKHKALPLGVCRSLEIESALPSSFSQDPALELVQTFDVPKFPTSLLLPVHDRICKFYESVPFMSCFQMTVCTVHEIVVDKIELENAMTNQTFPLLPLLYSEEKVDTFLKLDNLLVPSVKASEVEHFCRLQDPPILQIADVQLPWRFPIKICFRRITKELYELVHRKKGLEYSAQPICVFESQVEQKVSGFEFDLDDERSEISGLISDILVTLDKDSPPLDLLAATASKCPKIDLPSSAGKKSGAKRGRKKRKKNEDSQQNLNKSTVPPNPVPQVTTPLSSPTFANDSLKLKTIPFKKRKSYFENDDIETVEKPVEPPPARKKPRRKSPEVAVGYRRVTRSITAHMKTLLPRTTRSRSVCPLGDEDADELVYSLTEEYEYLKNETLEDTKIPDKSVTQPKDDIHEREKEYDFVDDEPPLKMLQLRQGRKSFVTINKEIKEVATVKPKTPPKKQKKTVKRASAKRKTSADDKALVVYKPENHAISKLPGQGGHEVIESIIQGKSLLEIETESLTILSNDLIEVTSIIKSIIPNVGTLEFASSSTLHLSPLLNNILELDDKTATTDDKALVLYKPNDLDNKEAKVTTISKQLENSASEFEASIAQALPKLQIENCASILGLINSTRKTPEMEDESLPYCATEEIGEPKLAAAKREALQALQSTIKQMPVCKVIVEHLPNIENVCFEVESINFNDKAIEELSPPLPNEEINDTEYNITINQLLQDTEDMEDALSLNDESRNILEDLVENYDCATITEIENTINDENLTENILKKPAKLQHRTRSFNEIVQSLQDIKTSSTDKDNSPLYSSIGDLYAAPSSEVNDPCLKSNFKGDTLQPFVPNDLKSSPEEFGGLCNNEVECDILTYLTNTIDVSKGTSPTLSVSPTQELTCNRRKNSPKKCLNTRIYENISDWEEEDEGENECIVYTNKPCTVSQELPEEAILLEDTENKTASISELFEDTDEASTSMYEPNELDGIKTSTLIGGGNKNAHQQRILRRNTHTKLKRFNNDDKICKKRKRNILLQNFKKMVKTQAGAPHEETKQTDAQENDHKQENKETSDQNKQDETEGQTTESQNEGDKQSSEEPNPPIVDGKHVEVEASFIGDGLQQKIDNNEKPECTEVPSTSAQTEPKPENLKVKRAKAKRVKRTDFTSIDKLLQDTPTYDRSYSPIPEGGPPPKQKKKSAASHSKHDSTQPSDAGDMSDVSSVYSEPALDLSIAPERPVTSVSEQDLGLCETLPITKLPDLYAQLVKTQKVTPELHEQPINAIQPYVRPEPPPDQVQPSKRAKRSYTPRQPKAPKPAPKRTYTPRRPKRVSRPFNENAELENNYNRTRALEFHHAMNMCDNSRAYPPTRHDPSTGLSVNYTQVTSTDFCSTHEGLSINQTTAAMISQRIAHEKHCRCKDPFHILSTPVPIANVHELQGHHFGLPEPPGHAVPPVTSATSPGYPAQLHRCERHDPHGRFANAFHPHQIPPGVPRRLPGIPGHYAGTPGTSVMPFRPEPLANVPDVPPLPYENLLQARLNSVATTTTFGKTSGAFNQNLPDSRQPKEDAVAKNQLRQDKKTSNVCIVNPILRHVANDQNRPPDAPRAQPFPIAPRGRAQNRNAQQIDSYFNSSYYVGHMQTSNHDRPSCTVPGTCEFRKKRKVLVDCKKLTRGKFAYNPNTSISKFFLLKILAKKQRNPASLLKLRFRALFPSYVYWPLAHSLQGVQYSSLNTILQRQQNIADLCHIRFRVRNMYTVTVVIDPVSNAKQKRITNVEVIGRDGSTFWAPRTSLFHRSSGFGYLIGFPPLITFKLHKSKKKEEKKRQDDDHAWLARIESQVPYALDDRKVFGPTF